jgi:hypothetical protein
MTPRPETIGTPNTPWPHALFGLVFVTAFGGLTAACGGEDTGPEMRPGENCLSHHAFSAAGTVFKSAASATSDGLAGAIVTIKDANAKQLSLTSNAVGNFYTLEPLAFPLAIEVAAGGAVQKMRAAPNGGCNGCHAQPPAGGAPGRIHAP